MKSERMRISEIERDVWLLNDNGESTCYVVIGSERAIVIDTANGREDLREIVRDLTDKPLVVVNTHGHLDHIYGNVFFDEAWLHPADAEIAKAHFSWSLADFAARGLKPCPLRDLKYGQRFDLGGTVAEVVPVPGHTPGSIAILDRERRLLFSGDGMNPHIWMQLDDCLPIAELRKSLAALKRDYGDAFDRVLAGHATDYLDAGIVDRLIVGCDQILSGDTAADRPYEWFGGVCNIHPYDDTPGAGIVYRPEKQ